MKYEQAAKLWGMRRLDKAGITYDEVDHVNFQVYSNVGCPTCGPETSYEASVWYVVAGKWGKQVKDFNFYGLDEILQELFAISE